MTGEAPPLLAALPPLLAALPAMLRGRMTHEPSYDGKLVYCARAMTWALAGEPCPYCEKESPDAR